MIKLVIYLFLCFNINSFVFPSFKELRFKNVLSSNKIYFNSFKYLDINGELYLFGYVTSDEYVVILKNAKFLYKKVHNFLKKDDSIEKKTFDNVFAKNLKKKYLSYKRFKNVEFFYINKKLYIFAPNISLYDKYYISNIIEYIQNLEIDIDFVYLNVT